MSASSQTLAQRAEVARRPVRPAEASAAKFDAHLVTLVAPTSFAASQYRGLANQLRANHPGLRVIGVSSPGPGDGKTTTAINLAGAIARDGEPRTLLVSGDLRRPSLTRLFGLEGRPGLTDLILDYPKLVLDEVVVQYPSIGLSILPSGRCVDDPYRVLQSMRANGLLTILREHYRTVIFDAPPLLPVPDCGAIVSEVDGFLLVVAAHHTPRELLEDALSMLEPDKVVGLVFNGDDQASRFSRQYGAYYQTTQGRGR